MKRKEAENLVKFLSDPENYDDEVVEKARIEKEQYGEETRQRLLIMISGYRMTEIEKITDETKSKQEARKKLTEAKRRQAEFTEKLAKTAAYKNGTVIYISSMCNTQYRNGETLSEEEKKETEARDRERIEILKKIITEGGDE